jgi:membrane protein implicated in regulation of membrane protease activity
MVLGLVLLALEIVMPGVFLLWIGIAALVVGAISLMPWQTEFWVWQVQVLVFLVLALISAYAGRKVMASQTNTDQPLLNRRAEQLIGRTATLADPILEGRGRIKLGDTVWRVSGPDLPAGARVIVIAVSDAELVVAAA